MTRSHVRASNFQLVKKLGPQGLLTHVKQGYFCSLGTWWGNFNGGPSYRMLGVGLIINFVSPLFSRVEAMLVFLLFLGIVFYTLGNFFVVLIF
jgi:hypothetical protein